MKVNYPIISADPHIVDTPNTYTDYMIQMARRAPHVIETDYTTYVIDGMKRTINKGLIAAAGQAPDDLNPKLNGELPRSGWDSEYRLADQDRDGVLQKLSIRRLEWFMQSPRWDYKKASMMPTTG